MPLLTLKLKSKMIVMTDVKRLPRTQQEYSWLIRDLGKLPCDDLAAGEVLILMMMASRWNDDPSRPSNVLATLPQIARDCRIGEKHAQELIYGYCDSRERWHPGLMEKGWLVKRLNEQNKVCFELRTPDHLSIKRKPSAYGAYEAYDRLTTRKVTKAA